MTILNLINFPIGTFIGAYALYVLLQDAAADCLATCPRRKSGRGEALSGEVIASGCAARGYCVSWV